MNGSLPVNIFFSLVALLIALPVLVFFLEILAATFCKKIAIALPPDGFPRPALAILVPAHNEEKVIAETLEHIRKQLQADDQLVVVADNCTDNSASIARSLGATVIERSDPLNRGKGFALEFGVRFLERYAPEIVIVIDADCRVDANALDMLAKVCVMKNRPVQAYYRMDHPCERPGIKQRIALFAWRVKNYVRPLGLECLGLPCQLMGTGMAFPFSQLRQIKLGSGQIVEDMKMGTDLAAAGFPPIFFPPCEVSSYFPESSSAETSQRTRWEHGHMAMIVEQFPALVWKSLVDRNFLLLAMALDLLVPPLTLLGLIVTSLFAFSAVAAWLFMVTTAFYLSGIIFILFLLSVMLAWLGFGRSILSLADILTLPIYMVKKLPLYFQFITNRQKKWKRTERD